MSLDDFSTDARLLIEFGKETRAKEESLQKDIATDETATPAEQYAAKMQAFFEASAAFYLLSEEEQIQLRILELASKDKATKLRKESAEI